MPLGFQGWVSGAFGGKRQLFSRGRAGTGRRLFLR